jgi:ZIP family zinc transporter
MLSAAFALPVLLGATVGYWIVQGQPDVVKFALLAFTAGTLLTVTVEEMIPEAHEEPDSRWATLGLISGFALFAFLSSYLGQ